MPACVWERGPCLRGGSDFPLGHLSQLARWLALARHRSQLQIKAAYALYSGPGVCSAGDRCQRTGAAGLNQRTLRARLTGACSLFITLRRMLFPPRRRQRYGCTGLPGRQGRETAEADARAPAPARLRAAVTLICAVRVPPGCAAVLHGRAAATACHVRGVGRPTAGAGRGCRPHLPAAVAPHGECEPLLPGDSPCVRPGVLTCQVPSHPVIRDCARTA
mgnify:CR=1 FL=1